MKRLLIILVFIAPIVTYGQDNSDHETFVFETSLPDEIQNFYKHQIVSEYRLRTDVNPFYLKGDFDGDKKPDFAINIVDRRTNKTGIVIYHSGTKKHFILGAAKPFNDKHPGDDFSWMDVWKVTFEKGKKTDELLIIKTESSSGLIYWTGREYKWKQLGD